MVLPCALKMTRPSLAAIAAVVLTLSTRLELVVAGDAPPVPDAFGSYAIVGDKLVSLTKNERFVSDLPANIALIIHDKPVTVLPASSYQVRTLSYVRYDVSGDISKGVSSKAISPAKKPPSRYRFVPGIGKELALQVTPYDGKPDMVRLSFKGAIEPGLYELDYGSKAVGFSIVWFGVGKWTEAAISVDHYFGDFLEGLDFYGSEGRSDLGAYKPAHVLDEILDRQRSQLAKLREKDQQDLLKNLENLFKPFSERPPATQKEIDKALSDDATKIARARVKLGIFSNESRELKTQVANARRAIAEGDYDSAEKLYAAVRSTIIRAAEPTFAEAATDFESTSSLALTSLKHDQPDRSIEFAFRALEKCPHAHVLLVVSANYARLGRRDEAAFWLRKALESRNVERGYIEKTFEKEFVSPELKQILDERFR